MFSFEDYFCYKHFYVMFCVQSVTISIIMFPSLLLGDMEHGNVTD